MATRKDGKQGHKTDKLWRDALMRAVKRAVGNGKKTKRLEALADKCVERGLAGDMQAIKEIGDRLDGKPAQAVNLSGDPENPITFIERVIVKAKD